MDDIKLFGKRKKQLKNLMQKISVYSKNIGMEFGIEKCVLLIMKTRKRQITERIELPNQERIRMLGEKENYKYLGILEANTMKQAEMKEKIE